MSINNLNANAQNTKTQKKLLKITHAHAALMLGKSPQSVRTALKENVAPYGYAVKGKGSRYDYHISPELLKKYVGACIYEKYVNMGLDI